MNWEENSKRKTDQKYRVTPRSKISIPTLKSIKSRDQNVKVSSTSNIHNQMLKHLMTTNDLLILETCQTVKCVWLKQQVIILFLKFKENFISGIIKCTNTFSSSIIYWYNWRCFRKYAITYWIIKINSRQNLFESNRTL